MKETLKLFTKSDLRKASLALLDQLEMRYTLGAGKPLQTKDLFAGKSLSKAAKEALDIVTATWFVALIDERTFDGHRDNLEFRTAIEGAKDEKYKGMFIFAIEVMPDAKLSRTVAANITRAFNKLAVDKPVVVMIRQAERLSIATCERGRYNRSGNIGEKLGKVSVLHNINCANAHRGHCDLLKRMEGNRANNFDSLYKKWLEVFDVKLLSKRFYDELFEWYQWAMSLVGSGRMHFPAWPKDGHGNESRDETVIRIITRMLFIWFIKEKGLIPASLFNQRELKRIVKDFNPQAASAHNYYNAILQNLFFATLNCEKSERKFIPESYHGKNEGYEVNSLYRGDDLLNIEKKEFLALLKDIPYLNGGLFERLDSGQNYYDGFSKEAKRRAIVPDMLFFREDVNDGHCGLITLFEKYVFTVEENTPIEQDISLDPELLGRVFENLLGAYNPETQETARKATGSYYTPREIVEYMVNESLVQHLIKTGINEKQIRDLLEYHDGTQTELTDDQRKQVMTSLYHVKILDPACGSGAFPMGMLQQMVHVLRQIDPDNAHWEAFIKTTAGAQAEQAYSKTKDAETRKLQLDEIENAFNLRLANPDYARKLFIIQNCIYGVDIQPIAMQISKLRFFISLISEQNNDSILPLPNLETKFVCANTLIGIDKTGGSFSSDELEQKKDELIEIRKKLFYARTAKTKKKYRGEDDKIRKELEKMIADMAGLGTSVAQQLVSWNPYDQNASSPFFDAEWMFGVKDGFDVVIGNPPYVVVTNSSIYLPYFKTARCYEMYAFFFEKGLNLLRSGGVISFITASLYIKGLKFQSLREFLEKESSLISLKNVGDDVFENVEMPTAVFIASKSKGNWSFADMIPGGRILEKMDSSGTQLQKFTNIQRGFEIGRDLVTLTGKYPFLTGSNVEKYTFRSLSYISEYVYLQFMKDDYYYTGPRLLLRETGSSLTVLYLEDKIYSNRSLYSIKTKDNKFLPKYVLACLNSKALQYYYSSKFRSDTELFPKIRIKQAKQLPVPAATPAQQQPIISLVDKILAAKKANPQADTNAWEREIDRLVYELYGLKKEEVKVVEGGA
ncbi:MAG: TaqI-like C-terminal specificity domain-containing protein [Bacteroidales bacterium]|nr:TaqI-like C-terminal specificity domain-containing protein [Bacteroidales bacterium]